jgi:hypothetical protein
MKRKTENINSVSLFPIFNILICTLGVLIFILSTLTVISLGTGKSLRIVPEKIRGEHDKLPHYLIWDGSTLINLSTNDSVVFNKSLSEFKYYNASFEYISERLQDTKLGEVIENVKKNANNEYFIIFLRAKGFTSFDDLQYFILKNGIDIGYEPMENNIKIRL